MTIKKVYQFKDARSYGHGIVYQVGKDVGEGYENIKKEYPTGDWHGGYQVNVNGYDILAYPKIEKIDSHIEYIDLFDDVLYSALIEVGKAKGIVIDNDIITNEILADIRSNIIHYVNEATNFEVNLAYSDGESVTVEDNIVEPIELECHHGCEDYVLYRASKGLDGWLEVQFDDGDFNGIVSYSKDGDGYESISESIPTYNIIKDKAIKYYNENIKVEDNTISEEVVESMGRLTESDKVKLDIMFDVITSEVEYCFDLNYNSDETWTLDERVKALIKVIEVRAKDTIKEILADYDTEYFSEDIRRRVADLDKPKLDIGDSIYVDNNETLHVISLDNERIGLLDLSGYVSGTYSSINSLISYLNSVHDTYEIIKDGYKKS